jgi:DNA-binding NarL/FixJ family response regulator
MEHSVRVLIVDDGVHSRNGLRALLTSCPAIAVIGEAVDGQQAVQLVEECQPDVVVMDVHMPVLDGVRATRLIKSRWPQTRIVILTFERAYRGDAIAAGADCFLVKGCPTEELLRSISLQPRPRTEPEKNASPMPLGLARPQFAS